MQGSIGVGAWRAPADPLSSYSEHNFSNHFAFMLNVSIFFSELSGYFEGPLVGFFEG